MYDLPFVEFRQDPASRGWITLLVGDPREPVHIDCSYAYEPFGDLVEFLSSVLDGQAGEMSIDEEGHAVGFRAVGGSGPGLVRFEVLDGPSGPVVFSAECNRAKFIAKFTAAFVDFCDSRYSAASWDESVGGPMPRASMAALNARAASRTPAP